ncbi:MULTISPECIES: hypothetical protein [unclassified Bradyrhizobium]|uniref:hypothetical protein n=1 Tax=unclassified Bradyrhizobium TaxID=2631580 RepID=UPI002916B1AF|nr:MULTISPECIES: hypothetical protein [unclassified Bradyrhizobium]
MSAWNDFSDSEKLAWLRSRLAKLEQSLGALTHHVEEIGNAVEELEAKQQGTK